MRVVTLVAGEHKTGLKSQTVLLARALGAVVGTHVWAPSRWDRFTGRAVRAYGDTLRPLAPDLLVTGGARTVPVARALATRLPALQRVHYEHPRISPGAFDAVVAARHDRVRGANVVSVLGGLHAPRPAGLPRPAPGAAALLCLGGRNSRYRFSVDDAVSLGQRLADALRGRPLWVLGSRRTPVACYRAVLHAIGRVETCWHPLLDAGRANPYRQLLYRAAAVLVTADSIAMVTEACSTGVPVWIVPIKERLLARPRRNKFADFHRDLLAGGHARLLIDTCDDYEPVPLPALDTIAARVRALLHNRDQTGRR